MGNPFSQTEGRYHYGISNVTVQIPLDWLDKLLPRTASPQSEGEFASLRVLAQNQTCSECISGNYIYVHLGNITIDLEGKNWELFITRLINTVAPYVIADSIATSVAPSSDEWFLPPSVTWNLNAAALSTFMLGLIVAAISLYTPRFYLAIKKRRRVTHTT